MYLSLHTSSTTRAVQAAVGTFSCLATYLLPATGRPGGSVLGEVGFFSLRIYLTVESATAAKHPQQEWRTTKEKIRCDPAG